MIRILSKKHFKSLFLNCQYLCLYTNAKSYSFKASYCVLNSSTAERLAKYVDDRYSLVTLHLQDDNLGASSMKEVSTNSD